MAALIAAGHATGRRARRSRPDATTAHPARVAGSFGAGHRAEAHVDQIDAVEQAEQCPQRHILQQAGAHDPGALRRVRRRCGEAGGREQRAAGLLDMAGPVRAQVLRTRERRLAAQAQTLRRAGSPAAPRRSSSIMGWWAVSARGARREVQPVELRELVVQLGPGLLDQIRNLEKALDMTAKNSAGLSAA